MVFDKILVPVVGTEADEKAIKLACWLAKQSGGRIYAVYVIAIDRSLPIDAEVQSDINKAEEILDRMEKVAIGQDCRVDTDILQAREAGPAIVDVAKERAVDCILMGVKYKSRFGEFSLGEVALYVLKNAPAHVLLYQQLDV